MCAPAPAAPSVPSVPSRSCPGATVITVCNHSVTYAEVTSSEALHARSLRCCMSACECAGCGRAFTSVSAFDRHQSADYRSAHPVTCHDPAARGLAVDQHVRGPQPRSCRSGRPGERSRMETGEQRASEVQEVLASLAHRMIAADVLAAVSETQAVLRSTFQGG